jgi:phosphomannomutase
MDASIFKAYDIRGIYPTEIDEAGAEQIGRSFAGRLTEDYPARAIRIAVGRDSRLSSPQLHAAFVKGVLAGGISIDDLGLVPSELVYFAVGKFGYDAGAVVTASHNPKEYNGIRMIDHDGVMQSGKSLLEWMKKHPDLQPAKKAGVSTEKNLVNEYVEHALSFIQTAKLKPLNVVVDAGNGMAGVTIPELFKRIPGKLIGLNLELDGNFPNRPPNPLDEASQRAAKAAVKKEGADLGVIFDGDADRVFFVTEKGEVLRGDIGLLILARALLAHEPGAAVSYNLVCSRIVREKIAEWGGTPVRTPVGFVNVSRPLHTQKAVMGGETAAHYCYRDNYCADSGLISLVLMLELLSTSGQKLSELAAGLNPYFRKELAIEVFHTPPVIEKLKAHYANSRLDELDGLTVEYDDWWFNVRGSNTEPLLRITVETNKKTALEPKIAELSRVVAEAVKG